VITVTECGDETYPAKTAKPGLFSPVKIPDVRNAPTSKKTTTTASFPAVLAIIDNAIMGHSNKTQKPM
jgi:hypothetical protein